MGCNEGFRVNGLGRRVESDGLGLQGLESEV